MNDKPYNPNPSLQLIEAFQKVNVADTTVHSLYILGEQMCPSSQPDKALEKHFHTLFNAWKTVQTAVIDVLDALHRDDLASAQSAVQVSQKSKEVAEETLRVMFELYVVHQWNSKDARLNLKNKKGRVLRYYGDSRLFYGPPRPNEDNDLPF